MNIDQLPNGLRQLAEKRREEEKDKNFYASDIVLDDAFEWDLTKEGEDFWSSIDGGGFSVYTNLYPAHNWIEDYPGEYALTSYDSKGNITIEKIDVASIGTRLHEEMEGLVITPDVLANGYYAGEDQPKEVRDAWVKGYEYALRHYSLDDIITNLIPDNTFKGMSKNPPDVVYVDTSTTLTEDANLTGGSGDNYIPKAIAHYAHIGDDTKEIYKDLIDKEVKLYKVPYNDSISSQRGESFYGVQFNYKDGTKSEIINMLDDNTGIKDNNQKISYQEIDFNFIDLMAASMTKNKDKYPPFNWHKTINKMDLVDAILRHTRKVKQPIEGDVETVEEHLVNIACNSMMLWYQYRYYKD